MVATQRPGQICRRISTGVNAAESAPAAAGIMNKEVVMSDCIHRGRRTIEPCPDVPDEVIDRLMHGAIDLHCHSGPSVMPRALNHVDAIREAQGAGMHAVLFKDHYYSVTPVVELLK